MHVVVETHPYLAAADDAGLSEVERDAIVDALSANPKLGDLMVGAGGARKFVGLAEGKARAAGIASSPISAAMKFLSFC